MLTLMMTNNRKELPVRLQERMIWVDWMKAIGIYFIVAGHFFAFGYRYIYVFSVPLFFFISGFLCRREHDNKVFFKKIWFNMVIPMVILSTVVFSILCIKKQSDFSAIFHYVINLLLGFHSSLKCLWFVYTLICLKLILQFGPRGKCGQVILLIALPALGLWLDEADPFFIDRNLVSSSNALVDSTMAYPFFIGGYYLRRWKTWINEFNNLSAEIIIFIISGILMCGSAYLNGPVWMYINGYGKNFLLFLIGGTTGTLCVLIVSRWIGNLWTSTAIIISKGTIIILAFHIYMIPYIKRLIAHSHLSSLFDYPAAAILTLAFVPVIIFVMKHCPLIMGKYRA